MIRRRLAGLAVVAAALLLIFPLTSAEAAEHDLEFTNGPTSFVLGGTTLDLPAQTAGLTGTWDDASGNFVGSTTFNPVSLTVSTGLPDPAEVTVQVTLLAGSNNNVTGTVDPTTGDVDLDALMALEIQIPLVTPPIVCTSPSFNVDLTATGDDAFGPLPFDPQADYSMELTGAFVLPQFQDADCAVAAIINQQLGIPEQGLSGTATLPLVRGTPAPPTTPTTQETTTTAGPGGDGAGAGAGQAARPRFTG